MKLHTLIEYCLLIILSGVYFAFLGFQSKGMTFILGVLILYIIIYFATRKILPQYVPNNKKMSLLLSVLSIIGTVFVTTLLLTILAI